MDIIEYCSDLLGYARAEILEIEEIDAVDRGNKLEIRCWTR